MPKTLVTGATGFTGAHVAARLVERGDEVRLGVTDGEVDDAVRDLDCERVPCRVLDRRATRRMLRGVDRVFHCSSLMSVRPSDAERVFEINVQGTKTVLEECLRAGVERVVYTSSAAALGPADERKTADEEQLFTAGHLGIPYVNSVHEAEVEAMRLAAQGLPLVCVNPTVTFGAGDYNLSSTRIVRSFILGRIAAYTDGAVNIVDVRDVADGHLLADERGAVAERYVLGARNFTFERLFAERRYERAAALLRRRERLTSLLERLDGVLRATHSAPRLVVARHPVKERFDAFWIVGGRVADWGAQPGPTELAERTAALLDRPRRPATVPPDEIDEIRIVSAWVAEHEPPELRLDPAPDAEALAAMVA